MNVLYRQSKKKSQKSKEGKSGLSVTVPGMSADKVPLLDIPDIAAPQSLSCIRSRLSPTLFRIVRAAGGRWKNFVHIGVRTRKSDVHTFTLPPCNPNHHFSTLMPRYRFRGYHENHTFVGPAANMSDTLVQDR